ncbi:MAG: hypothetical protein R3C18_22980 [Planctomycetaceae bacterium]
MRRLNAFFMLAVLFLVSTVSGDDVIPADLAAGRAGEKATVEMHVESSRLLSDRAEPVCFLNSQKNYRDSRNFTVVIFSKALKKFAERDIENPAEFYANKNLRVTGEIGLRQGSPQMIVEYPGQIEVVEEDEKK